MKWGGKFYAIIKGRGEKEARWHKKYASNISWEEFELIRESLEGVKKRIKLRKVDLYIRCFAQYGTYKGFVK